MYYKFIVLYVVSNIMRKRFEECRVFSVATTLCQANSRRTSLSWSRGNSI